MRIVLVISLIINLLGAGAAIYGAHHILQRFSLDFLFCRAGLGPCNYETLADSHMYYISQAPKVRDPIVMLGDSITERGHWNELFTRSDIMNRGVSGDTTHMVLNRLDEVISLKPRLVYLMIGTNDVLMGQKPHEIMPRFKMILQRLEEAGIPAAVLTTLMVSRQRDEQTGANQQLKHLNRLIRQTCMERGLKLIDLEPAVCPEGYLPDSHTHDGLHLNWRAYFAWRRAMLSHLPPVLPQHCGRAGV